MTYKFGYILHRSCWPSFVRMCWTIKSTATWLSPPRGMMISAYFFVGRMKSSKAGFTNFEYCNIRISNQNSFTWRNRPSKSDKEYVRLIKIIISTKINPYGIIPQKLKNNAWVSLLRNFNCSQISIMKLKLFFPSLEKKWYNQYGGKIQDKIKMNSW